MPEIQVRALIAADIAALIALEHHYNSDYVWQLEYTHNRDAGQIKTSFRQVRLPRSVRVEYPREPSRLSENFGKRSGILVALLENEVIGYISLADECAPLTTWVTDIVVTQHMRRQGIGSALLLAAQEWALHMDNRSILMEMQPKNHPAIQLALKLGFEFCGYNDRHYANHGSAIFFCKSL